MIFGVGLCCIGETLFGGLCSSSFAAAAGVFSGYGTAFLAFGYPLSLVVFVWLAGCNLCRMPSLLSRGIT